MIFKQSAEKNAGNVGRTQKKKKTKRRPAKRGNGIPSPSTPTARPAGQSGSRQRRTKSSVREKKGYDASSETASTSGREVDTSHSQSDASSGKSGTSSDSSSKRHGGGGAKARKRPRRREKETRGP